MIVLSVTSYNGAPADAGEAVEACFDELGGSIGRADGNLLVLPDPMRTVSRVHAHVAFRGGAYTIEDRGSNPIQLNGKAVGRERPHPLAAGDVLRIGGYEIRVREHVPQPATPEAAAPAIPPDWDPMAATTGTARAAPSRAAPAPAAPHAPPATAAAERVPAAGGSIDDLFGLHETGGLVDPSLSAFIAPGEEPSTARVASAVADAVRPRPSVAGPMSAGSGSAQASGAGAFAAKAADRQDRAQGVAAEGAGRVRRERAAPVVSWDGGGVRETKVVAASAPPAPAPARKAPAPLQAPPSAVTAAAAAADEAALLQAFLEGLGTVDAAPTIARLTPELMRRVGALLGESVRGAVDLLHARAAVKREVRAEVTSIRPQQNNVIKFSPSAAVALQYLLGEAAPGFMGAEASVRDAFDDLRAHELAVMAGMRAALTGLLQRFDPAQLETRIVARSALGSLLAGGRRAQLWEAYCELFAQLSTEARDDFHEVFGHAFVRAYEEQLLGLQQDPLETPAGRAPEA